MHASKDEQGSPHPKTASPRAGTMIPSVRPTNTIGSAPGPAKCRRHSERQTS